MKFFAKIPIEFKENTIEWLLIEPCINSGKKVGWLLIQQDALKDPKISYDTFFSDIEYAYQAASEDFGVEKIEWKKYEE